jgi:hypothetical protein
VGASEVTTFRVGSATAVSSVSPAGTYGAIFEDDGDTGYFYALQHPSQGDGRVLDAVHIYDVQNVADQNVPSRVAILWSADGMKCVLLINDYPHAVFDFAARRGYCRTNFPNSAGDEGRSWNTSDHQWKDDVMKWFTRPAR